MTKAITKEVREKIVRAYENGYGTVAELAEMFEVTGRVIYKYLRQYQETGDLTPQTQPGRPAILTQDNLAIIRGFVEHSPDSTLAEYRDAFYKETGIAVTIVTIHNACKALNLRRKKRVFLPQSKSGRTFKKNV